MKPSLSRLSLLSLFMPVLASAATPNLIGRLTNVHVNDAENGQKRIQFQVTVSNDGDAAATGNLRFKPFLVAQERSEEAVVLPNLESAINLAPATSVTLDYSQVLPRMAARTWWLSGILNPNWAIPETGPISRYDNTPDLVAVGSFAVAQAPAIATTGLDLFPRVVDDNAITWGSISHALRAIVRNDSQASAPHFPNDQLRALFGVLNFSTKKVSLLDYNRLGDPENPEKVWYAISYATEKDAADRDLYVDYYRNNILFGHVAPGQYRFFTLLNSQDLIPEANIYDNLEQLDLSLRLLSFQDNNALYVGARAGEPINLSLNITPSYPGNLEYQGELALEANVPKVTIPATTISSDDLLSVSVPTLSAGKHSGLIKLRTKAQASLPATGVFEQAAKLPIKVWVYEGNAIPKLEASTSTIALVAKQDRDSAPQDLVIKNTGTADLEFVIKTDKQWLKLSKLSGKVAPGGQTTITVMATAKANLGNFSHSNVDARIIISANTLERQEETPIQVTLETQH